MIVQNYCMTCSHMFYHNCANGLICSSFRQKFRPFFTGFSRLKQSVYRHTLTKTQCLQSFYWISDPLLLIHEGCKVILKPDLNKQLKIKGFFKILSTLSMCTVFTGHCSYIRCFVGAFDSLWKSPRFLEWTILLEWTNLCKTAFQDLRYFGCVYWDTYPSINGKFVE